MNRQYEALIAELVYHTRALANEAKQGSEEARRWCIQCFPGHTDFFLDLWPESSKPKRPQQQRNVRQ